MKIGVRAPAPAGGAAAPGEQRPSPPPGDPSQRDVEPARPWWQELSRWALAVPAAPPRLGPPRPEAADWEPPRDGERIGVCLSGGGVRSAAYNLGALQSLQAEEVLQQADYLAAVSGGSYIAAAHTMVQRSTSCLPTTGAPRRVATGVGEVEQRGAFSAGERARVERSLGHGDPGAGEGDDPASPGTSAAERRRVIEPFAPGSPEEAYLRARTSYLAPGLLGKLALLYRVIVGLVVNLAVVLMVLVPLGIGLGLLYRWLQPVPAYEESDLGAWARELSPQMVVGLVLGVGAPLAAVLLIGVVQTIRRVSERSARLADMWSLRLFKLALLSATVLVLGPLLLAVAPGLADALVDRLGAEDAAEGSSTTRDAVPWTVAGVSVGSATTVLLAVLATVGAGVRGADDALGPTPVPVKVWRSLGRAGRATVVVVAAYVAGPLLVLTVVLAAAAWTSAAGTAVEWWVLGAVLLVCVATTSGVARWADLTSWSMHPFYRRRLATAFALRRRSPVPGELTAEERPYDEVVRLSEMGPARGERGPRLVVCAAANISTYGVTGVGRRATSFTFDPDYIGGPVVGYHRTGDWEGKEKGTATRGGRAVSLLAAVAMSGAALSPSMGKMSRGHLRFLLTLANVRLGVWVPNPRRGVGSQDRPRPTQLLKEYFGDNSLHGKYLYVTDGGHYENLGLVELLRRGCTRIYCFDASGGDPAGLSTLGDALALARSELGVEIDLDVTPLFPVTGEDVPVEERGLAPKDCVAGSFPLARPTSPDRGGSATDGVLVYARTVVTEDAPWDVRSFGRRDVRFPNHSTVSQLYSDERFEAYRALGALAGRNAVALMATRCPGVGEPGVGQGGDDAPPAPAPVARPSRAARDGAGPADLLDGAPAPRGSDPREVTEPARPCGSAEEVPIGTARVPAWESLLLAVCLFLAAAVGLRRSPPSR